MVNWSSDFGTCIQLLRQAGRQWPNYQVKRGVTYRKFFKNANRDSKHTTVSSSTQRTYHPEKNSRYSKKNSIYQTWASPKFVCSGQCVLTERFEASIIFEKIFLGISLLVRLTFFVALALLRFANQRIHNFSRVNVFADSIWSKIPFPESIACKRLLKMSIDRSIDEPVEIARNFWAWHKCWFVLVKTSFHRNRSFSFTEYSPLHFWDPFRFGNFSRHFLLILWGRKG